MGLWSALTGRDKPVRPQLDNLFAVPGVAVTLATAMDITATGTGGVCYRRAEGPAFADAEARLVEFLDSDEGPDVVRVDDGFGFTWLIVHTDPSDPVTQLSSMVTDLHAVNTALQDDGFARGLLASVVAFTTAAGAPLGLVYRYTSGTFYPFAPKDGKQRDTLLEMQVRTQLAHEMPVEQDTGKQLPLWDCPVL